MGSRCNNSGVGGSGKLSSRRLVAVSTEVVADAAFAALAKASETLDGIIQYGSPTPADEQMEVAKDSTESTSFPLQF